jgi:hypothetical protein
MKRAFELYPRGLTGRVKEERKKTWMASHKQIEALLQRELLLLSNPVLPSAENGAG